MTTIPTITALPTPVPQTSDPTNFDARADEFLAALPTMVTEENASIAAMNTVAGEVSTNATNAAASATAASGSATTATTEAGVATTEAGIATTKASEAATSASNASASESAAAGYASALAGNINASRTVDLVATANVNKSSALANGQTLDGVTITTGMRILLTAQTTAADNGIYSAPASGTAPRSSDADTAAELASGSLINVTRGTAGAGSTWLHTTAPGFTLGSTSLTFSKRGDYYESKVAQGSSVSLTTITSADITNVTLPAGDWDVDGAVWLNPTGSTTFAGDFYGWVSTSSATLASVGDPGAACDLNAKTTGKVQSLAIPTKRFSLPSGGTVYLGAYAAFGTSTCGGFGYVRARRAA